MELRHCAYKAFCTPDPAQKVALTLELPVLTAALSIAEASPAAADSQPGIPPRPLLVHAAKVAKRSPFKPEGLAALLHAIAHIEFNAINLALDAAWRFNAMPEAYYRDWLRVASEEAYHFSLLRELLQDLGHDYGDFSAHDNLWQMCEKTAGDIVARMALVPRTLEARGLDATPLIQDKLRKVPTPTAQKAVAVLDIILRDEIGHVAIGNQWYRWLCTRDGLDPVAHYGVLVARYQAPRLFPPFNAAARKQAGFSDEELDWLLQ